MSLPHIQLISPCITICQGRRRIYVGLLRPHRGPSTLFILAVVAAWLLGGGPHSLESS